MKHHRRNGKSTRRLCLAMLAAVLLGSLCACRDVAYDPDTDTGYVEDRVFSTGIYTGDVVAGACHGQGRIAYNDGSTYEGQWKNNLQHGQGTMHWSNGDSYTGQFVDNMLQGQGTMTWATGNTYTGEFANNQPHGQGTFTWANGEKRTGLWENGKFVEQ